MFRVTRAEELALRLAMCMAEVQKQVTLAELARLEGLPEPMVAKLLGQLRKAGVVSAMRGRNGGYVLARESTSICAAEVLAAVSRDAMFEFACQDGGPPTDCDRTADCGLRSIWQFLEGRVSGVLQQTSLADLLVRRKQRSGQLQELWP